MARVASLDVDQPPLYPLDCDPDGGAESNNPRRLAKGFYGIGYGEMNDCLRAEFVVLKVSLMLFDEIELVRFIYVGEEIRRK